MERKSFEKTNFMEPLERKNINYFLRSFHSFFVFWSDGPITKKKLKIKKIRRHLI
jgi:hypothetical protein